MRQVYLTTFTESLLVLFIVPMSIQLCTIEAKHMTVIVFDETNNKKHRIMDKKGIQKWKTKCQIEVLRF